MMTFECAYCKKKYAANYTLRHHIRQTHPDKELPALPLGRKKKVSVASKVQKSSLLNNPVQAEHLLAVPVEQKEETYENRVSIKVPQRKTNLRKGLTKSLLTFSSIIEFETWKIKEEDETCARFVRRRGDFHYKDHVIRNYYCNRSGTKRVLLSRKRHIKMQGSCKIGNVCPAAISLKIFSAGQVTAYYFNEHRGHEPELAHLFLRREERLQIAAKLSIGVPFNDVLESIRGDPTCSNSMKAVSRSDLRNICNEFGIPNKCVLHQKDAQIVEEVANANSVAEINDFDEEETQAIVDNSITKDHQPSLEELKSRFYALVASIVSLIESDISKAKTAVDHLTKLLEVLRKPQVTYDKKKPSDEPHNNKITTRGFFSTNKKHKRALRTSLLKSAVLEQNRMFEAREIISINASTDHDYEAGGNVVH